MSKPNILIQLDGDPQASVFDAVVAADCQVDHLLRHHHVELDQIEALVHGGMFTRGPDDLRHTAIFVGGSNVRHGEEMLERVKQCFFGPMRVSVMMDANGANTTAVAAVLSAAQHVRLSDATAVVLAATGPVGSRAARLLAHNGASVRLASRSLDRAQAAADRVASQVEGGRFTAHQTASADETAGAIEGADLIIAAGAVGAQLVDQATLQAAKSLQVAIDLNAVPPAGLEGVDVMDRAAERHGIPSYGAIGVGGLKMKIHKASVRRLFESNDQVLDADEIYQIGSELIAGLAD